ncbi:hypothetical protein ACJJTC_018687 [Scirpophaga incertulas]
MLDCARNVKPDLYVVAELFTNLDHVDNIFVNRLGITSLIREAQAAWNANEQGRLVHRFGGRPVGSLRGVGGPPCPALGELPPPAAPDVAHAIFMDLTHDNPSHVHKRSVFDTLPTAAMVSMACCASGSSRGYDELVPHHIHVVDEERLYPEWGAAGAGATAARRVLNELHARLARGGYCELYVDQVDRDVTALTRHHPATRQSVILMAFTAFSPPDPNSGPRDVAPLRFEGELDEILFEMDLRHVDHKNGGNPLQVATVPLDQSAVFRGARRDGSCTVLDTKPLRPGTVVAVSVRPSAEHAAALRAAAAALAPGRDPLALAAPLRALALPDLAALLYCCDAEERDAGGPGVYDVPGHGPLVYAGLQGIESLLSEVRAADDLGHAVCANLRAGDWLLEYQWQRLQHRPRLAAVAERYRALLQPLGRLPRYLVPALASATLAAIYRAVAGAALEAVQGARQGALRRALALTAVQLSAAPPSAALPALPPPAAGAAPRAALSAGLPHFATGYMRCWGRDTFISLRGLYLLTGRFQRARDHILSYAACLRHGLIPNLLDGGKNARYNCRDAVWWVAAGRAAVLRRRARGPGAAGRHRAAAVPGRRRRARRRAHAATRRHAGGARRALPRPDRHRSRDRIPFRRQRRQLRHLDGQDGLLRGGRQPRHAGHAARRQRRRAGGARVQHGRLAGRAAPRRPLPRTPAWRAATATARCPAGPGRSGRSGCARTSSAASGCPPSPPPPPPTRGPTSCTAAASTRTPWAPRAPTPTTSCAATSSSPWRSRPDLFDPKRAWLALDRAESLLLGPLGLKTLDPADWAYRGDYDNANDGRDPSVAHGFNYHQGPEWVWPLGYYLRARLAFAHENGKFARTVAAAYATLAPAARELRDSPWRGLPELTNAGGAPCAHSCRTQAWSSACVNEALADLEAARRARPLGD